jgi:6-pyruvoyl-tetrahydropterin synthase
MAYKYFKAFYENSTKHNGNFFNFKVVEINKSKFMEKIDDRIIVEILTNKKKLTFESFALNMLLTRLKMTIASNHNANAIPNAILEFKQFMAKNENLPALQRDLKKLM